MINFKQLTLVSLSIFLSSSLGSIACALRVTRTYQPPGTFQGGPVIDGQIIQGQRVIQGQVIQGQPIQGQPIQGQPIQGQIIQGQPFIQGPVIQGRPIRGNVVRPQQIPPQDNQQQDAIAAARAKIAEQAENIKTLTNENSRLSGVEDTNNAMRQEYARLKKAYEDVGTELDQLKIKQQMNTAEPVDTSAQDEKLNQLNAQYQKAVEQNRTMSGQIGELAKENGELKNRLEDLSTAGGDMSGLKTSLNNANNRITEIGQQNQTLESENTRLKGELQTATANDEELNMRYSNLSQENERLKAEYQTATETNTTLDQRVNELSTQNQDYLASLNSRPATPAPAKKNYVAARRDSGVAAEHDRVLALNADLENENGLLMEQISELEGKIGSLDKKTEPKESALAVALPAVTGDAAPKFNILNWLIPFLLIGLTVGLYVFWTEENGRDVATGFTSARLRTDNDADNR